jgi:hypothetical protein
VEQPSLFTGTIVCAHPDCDKPVRSRGLCIAHYQAQRKTSMPPRSVDGCERPQQSKGYCMTHYTRSLYGQSLDDPITHRPEARTCHADGCDERPDGYSRFCSEHKPPKYPSLIRDDHGHKKCSRCEEWKPEEEFGPGNTAADGLQSQCRACYAEIKRSRAHGIGSRGRQRLLAVQGGVCAICGTDDPGSRWGWAIDHDHSCCDGTDSCGKCVRGVLCVGCNTGLGGFKDDPERMRRAIEYLQRPKLRAMA